MDGLTIEQVKNNPELRQQREQAVKKEGREEALNSFRWQSALEIRNGKLRKNLKCEMDLVKNDVSIEAQSEYRVEFTSGSVEDLPLTEKEYFDYCDSIADKIEDGHLSGTEKFTTKNFQVLHIDWKLWIAAEEQQVEDFVQFYQKR